MSGRWLTKSSTQWLATTIPSHTAPVRSPRTAKIDEREQKRPHHGHQQAVRPRVIHEIERVDRLKTRHDAKALCAEQHEHRSHDVEKRRSDDQGAQRHLGRDFLRSEGYRKVPDEHFTAPRRAWLSSARRRPASLRARSRGERRKNPPQEPAFPEPRRRR